MISRASQELPTSKAPTNIMRILKAKKHVAKALGILNFWFPFKQGLDQSLPKYRTYTPKNYDYRR